jgi:ADP-heptose:LPS heptosyltransferase
VTHAFRQRLASGLLFRAFDADRLLARARRRGARRLASAWIRGLGDVPFIVGEFVRHAARQVPGAEMTLLVRPGLEEACRWIEGRPRVVAVEEWPRRRNLDSVYGLAFPPPWEIRRALRRRGLEAGIDAVVPYPLGRWYERGFAGRRPRLQWTEAEAAFGRDFLDRAFPERPRWVVALNTYAGTGRYYDFDKEWGVERFAALMTALLDEFPDCRLVLVDADKVDGLPTGPRVLDARGRLSVAESTAVIAAADLFIGLDAGHANLLYFLAGVRLEMIVLLGRRDCFTPLAYPPASPGVRLTPVFGAGERMAAITPAAVLEAVRRVRARSGAA